MHIKVHDMRELFCAHRLFDCGCMHCRPLQLWAYRLTVAVMVVLFALLCRLVLHELQRDCAPSPAAAKAKSAASQRPSRLAAEGREAREPTAAAAAAASATTTTGAAATAATTTTTATSTYQ